MKRTSKLSVLLGLAFGALIFWGLVSIPSCQLPMAGQGGTFTFEPPPQYENPADETRVPISPNVQPGWPETAGTDGPEGITSPPGPSGSTRPAGLPDNLNIYGYLPEPDGRAIVGWTSEGQAIAYTPPDNTTTGAVAATIDATGRVILDAAPLGPAREPVKALWSQLVLYGTSILGGMFAENGRKRVARRMKAAPPGKVWGSWQDVVAAGLVDPPPEAYGHYPTPQAPPVATAPAGPTTGQPVGAPAQGGYLAPTS